MVNWLPPHWEFFIVAASEGHRTLNSSKLGHHRKTRVIYYFETRANKTAPLIREVREKSEVRDDEPPPLPPPSPPEPFDTSRFLDTFLRPKTASNACSSNML